MREVDVDPPASPIGHREALRVRNVGDPLRLLQAADSPGATTCAKIDDLDGVVAQCSHEEPLVLEIDIEMIDPSTHVRERNGLSQLEGRASCT